MRNPLPFNPRTTGPFDLLILSIASIVGWIRDYSRALLAAGTVILVAQIGVYAWKGVVFLGIPTIPNWMLIGIGVLILFAPASIVIGVLLGRWLYSANTQLISVMSAQSGEQRLKHISQDLLDELTILNQNGDEKDLSYLVRTRIEGRTALEVDSFDEDAGVLVASSMAGRSNQDIRRDRLSIRKIKTDMEQEVDEATEMKANYRDHVREQGAALGNWIVRTAQGATIPNGVELHDEMRSALEDIEPLAELDETPAGADVDDDLDRGDRDDDGDGEDETESASLDPEAMGILERAREMGNGNGGASADD